jgi:hypothetical protein
VLQDHFYSELFSQFAKQTSRLMVSDEIPMISKFVEEIARIFEATFRDTSPSNQ